MTATAATPPIAVPGGERVTAWSPLRHRAFAMLWTAWVVSNVCMWMSDVTAAWVMTTLTDSKVMVALVQSASNLPAFLVAIPGGAIADVVDRRRWFIGTQLWMAGVLAVLAVTGATGTLSAILLLLLVFGNGAGFAVRWPLFAAILPQVVSRTQLPQAIALHQLGVNASRIAGPLAGGAILAALGPAWVFATGAAMSLAAAWLSWLWRHESPPRRRRDRGRPFARVIQAGLRFVRRSPPMRAAMTRGFLMFFMVSGLLGLLPVLARDIGGGGVGAYTLLYACLASGAVTVAMLMPRLRRRLPSQVIVTGCMAVQGVSIAAVALSSHTWQAVPAVYVSGFAWLAAANTVGVHAQLSLPDRMRARGMSIYMMAVMAGGACGAASLGVLAEHIGLRPALLALAAMALSIAVLLRRRVVIARG